MFVIVTFHFVAYLDSSICCILFLCWKVLLEGEKKSEFIIEGKINKMKRKFYKNAGSYKGCML